MDIGKELDKDIKESLKNKKWTKGIALLMEKKKEPKALFSDRNYRDLSKCLRFEGEYQKAQDTLMEGLSQYPKNRKILLELYRLYSASNQWERGKEIITAMIKTHPQNPKLWIRLAKCYHYLGDIPEATKLYKTAIEKSTGQALADTIKSIEEEFFPKTENIESSYEFKGGKNNLGLFHHLYYTEDGIEKAYITKIIEKNKKREDYFYQEVIHSFPQLKNITPKCITVKRTEDVKFILMEKAQGRAPLKEDYQSILKEIYEISKTIEYSKDLEEYLRIPHYSLGLKNLKSQAISTFFSSIHRRSTNERLFKLVEKRMESEAYPDYIQEIFSLLKEYILGLKLYERIIPEKHYSFLHGDLGKHNILIDERNHIISVLDWNTYKFGPRWYDVANALTKGKFTLEEVKNSFLFQDHYHEKLSNIERIFFHYAIIMIWFQGVSKEKLQYKYHKDLLYALKEIHIYTKKENGENIEKVSNAFKPSFYFKNRAKMSIALLMSKIKNAKEG